MLIFQISSLPFSTSLSSQVFDFISLLSSAGLPYSLVGDASKKNRHHVRESIGAVGAPRREDHLIWAWTVSKGFLKTDHQLSPEGRVGVCQNRGNNEGKAIVWPEHCMYVTRKNRRGKQGQIWSHIKESGLDLKENGEALNCYGNKIRFTPWTSGWTHWGEGSRRLAGVKKWGVSMRFLGRTERSEEIRPIIEPSGCD